MFGFLDLSLCCWIVLRLLEHMSPQLQAEVCRVLHLNWIRRLVCVIGDSRRSLPDVDMS